MYHILACYIFLVSKSFLCLASFCAFILYELGPWSEVGFELGSKKPLSQPDPCSISSGQSTQFCQGVAPRENEDITGFLCLTVWQRVLCCQTDWCVWQWHNISNFTIGRVSHITFQVRKKSLLIKMFENLSTTQNKQRGLFVNRLVKASTSLTQRHFHCFGSYWMTMSFAVV